MAETEIALLLYGNGAGLGNFRFFVDDLATQLTGETNFDVSSIVKKETRDRASFFAALSAVPPNQKIKQLHVFSHSIGGGLYVGYHDATAAANRQAAVSAFPTPFPGGTAPRIGYDQVLDAETGGILTDHLIREPLASARAALKAKFSADSLIKLWGCNSGVSGWVYSDTDGNGALVYEQNAPATFYYWRALNTRNVPKPCIAQALSDYFGVAVYGAGSGSHVEVKYRGGWITSDAYKAATHRYAGEPETLRLQPDRGNYNKFSPSRP
jgi:hypothetical protein